MKISLQQSISAFQTQFQAFFPGLNVEFYNVKHGAFEGSKVSDQVAVDNDISTLNPKSNFAEFDGDISVKDFELLFENEYGLHTQVFRRSNDLWLQTSTTDDWSLETQNNKGIRSQQN